MFRVVVWNIEHGHRPGEIAEQLRSFDADLYLLFELDRGVKRTGFVDMFEFLRAKLGLEGRYVREFVEHDNWARRCNPLEQPGGGETGSAVFSRFPIKNYTAIGLPSQTYLTRSRRAFGPAWLQPRCGSRQAQIFEIAPFGFPFSVVSAHLEIWRVGWRHRRNQLGIALAKATNSSRIVGGDFNNVGGVWSTLFSKNYDGGETAKLRSFLREHGLTDPFGNEATTCGRFGMRAKLDWLSTSKDFIVIHKELIANGLSDHACLVVDYQPQHAKKLTVDLQHRALSAPLSTF